MMQLFCLTVYMVRMRFSFSFKYICSFLNKDPTQTKFSKFELHSGG